MADNKVQVNSGGEVFFCFKASNQMRPEYFSDELTNQSTYIHFTSQFTLLKCSAETGRGKNLLFSFVL
jgi:hypothetical protein